jgi:branched-chain amino acid transport system ATP-binding protein
MAGTLSGGEQQMLTIGRALMSNPKLLILDEPSTGLSPLLVGQVFRSLEQLGR